MSSCLLYCIIRYSAQTYAPFSPKFKLQKMDKQDTTVTINGVETPTHSVIEPAILYWGTPVVLISSTNEDGTSNVAPMSSAFFLGHNCLLGLSSKSKTTHNILRTKQLVLNLPDDSPLMIAAVNALARTTGTEVVPPAKKQRGYFYVKDKWARAKLTPIRSEVVAPERIKECPVQMECELVSTHDLFGNEPTFTGACIALEVAVRRVHVTDELRMGGFANRIDPDKWKPMIMSFQQLYGLKHGKLVESVLGRIDEELYRH